MSFRRRKNQHDVWKSLCEAQQAAIRGSGLPESFFESEARLIRFLSEGNLEGEQIDLRKIPDEQFRLVEGVVNMLFSDGWEQSSWTVLAAERLRRFGRYA